MFNYYLTECKNSESDDNALYSKEVSSVSLQLSAPQIISGSGEIHCTALLFRQKSYPEMCQFRRFCGTADYFNKPVQSHTHADCIPEAWHGHTHTHLHIQTLGDIH